MMRRLPAVLAGMALVAGCVFDRVALPAGADALIVHGTLNPGTTEQVVLVERALSGRVPLVRTPYDSLDPIVSDGGVPVRDAHVVIRRSNGDSVVLREDGRVRADGRGKGVYRFRNFDAPTPDTQAYPWFAVVPGAHYTLEVRTSDGVVTGSTTVPATSGSVAPIVPRQFFRDRDSLFLSWRAVDQAVRYEIRVESPTGPYLAFVDSLEYLVSGSLTHTITGRPHVFWPGIRHTISVSAVDRNYFDYYRSGSDDITSRGLISTVSGGFGVFGSMARVVERLVDVRAPQEGGAAGLWSVEGPIPLPAPALFELWPESETPGARRLTGNVPLLERDPRMVVAEQYGNSMQIRVFSGWSLRDTVVVINGTLNSTQDRFQGTTHDGQQVVYRRLR